MNRLTTPGYFDYAASTPLDPRVFAVMQPWLTQRWGNPSSQHQFGKSARAAIDSARAVIAEQLGCQPSAIIFTSGGTESVNLALTGVMRRKPGELLISPIEHPAVADTAAALASDTVAVRILPIQPSGVLDPTSLTVTADTALVSVMLANNEIGTIQPVAALTAAAKAANPDVIVHTDACQAAAYMDIQVDLLGVDLLSISSNKIYGPTGCGVLYVRPGVMVQPIFHGGGQERALRPGSENVAAIVGMAEALRLAAAARQTESKRLSGWRDQVIQVILQQVPSSRLHGAAGERLPHIFNIVFPGVSGDSFVFALDAAGVAASLGSACAAGSLDPSPTLLALGVSRDDARRSVRFSIGRFTTQADIDHLIATVTRVTAQLFTSDS